MILSQFVIYVLIYDYPKFRKDPSITFQEIANYVSVALAVAYRWIANSDGVPLNIPSHR